MEFAQYESSELKGVTRPCPDCAGEMTSTGHLKLDVAGGHWYLEYRCAVDGQLRDVWRPDTQPLAEAATKHPA